MKVLIAVSGGMDSVALLDLLARGKLAEFLRREIPPIELVGVAHFNHRIHSRADEYAQFVEKLAAQYRLPFFGGKSRKKLHSEADARDARFEFLNSVLRRKKADALALAHHADDQVETVLLNVIRGTGLLGLGGMEEFVRKKWRPLLGVSKKDLLKYCEKRRLKFVRDPTNEDAEYSRNFIRLRIIGEMEQLNPQVRAAFLRIARHAREGAELASLLAGEFLRRTENAKSLPLAQFGVLPPAVAKSVIREIYFREVGNLQKIEEVHIDEILRLARNPAGGKRKKCGELFFRTGKKDNERILSWK
jgi:tRNA(Ile)-lysidine synthase